MFHGLLSVTDTISSEERDLSTYIGTSSERLLQLIPSYIHSGGSGGEYKRQVQSNHFDNFTNKPLHGQFFREIVQASVGLAVLCGFTPETEKFIKNRLFLQT